MKRVFHLRVRRLHRYLGVILGVQFLFWTVGGLYFSWSDMDEVHGDHQRKKESLMPLSMAVVSPSVAWENIRKTQPADSLVSLSLVQILGKPVYQIKCFSKTKSAAQTYLADAVTGNLRGALSQDEAVQLAKNQFNAHHSAIEKVEYLTETNNHHEYREQPIPAYAVTFQHPSRTTVYVAAELGTVQKFRNDKWRVFDFLWMLHTMDYESRDNISNWALRLFSMAGLLTIVSGFVLFWVSSRRLRTLKPA